jgi:hypothetical protein
VIRGHANDKPGLRRQWQRWEPDTEPQASGALGSTAGIADDGTFHRHGPIRIGGSRAP